MCCTSSARCLKNNTLQLKFKFRKNASSVHSSPETRVFILVALARVNMSHWYFVRTSCIIRFLRVQLFFNYIIITLNLKNYPIKDYQTLNK